MPLWLYSLGRTLSNSAQIKIPFDKLVYNLLSVIIPCVIGLFLSRCFPNFKRLVLKLAKKFVIFLILSFIIITLIAKAYIFKLITWQQWVAGPLVPWCGFILGGFFAWIAKQPTKVISVRCVRITF
jgi:hypothetical protein